MSPSTFITPFTDGIGGAISSLGEAIVSGFKAVFLETSGTTTSLSAVGVVILVFAGIGVSLGLGRLVLGLIKGR